MAVQARRGRIGLRAQLQPRDVAQAHRRAVRIRTQHDRAELLDGRQLALHHDRGGDALLQHVGDVADRARRDLRVLLRDRVVDGVHRHLVADQLGRIDPHAHRALGAEQLRLADAGDALDFRQHVARGVVAQRDRVVGRVVGGQDREQQEVRARLVHAHALLRHRRRQPRRGAREAVLHVDLGEVGVGARLVADRDGAGAVGLADRLHVDHARRAVQFLLDDADDGLVHRLGRRARIGGGQDDGGRGDRRVLRDRQLRDRDRAEHDHEQRDDDREDRTFDEELGHVGCPISGWLPKRPPGPSSRARWRSRAPA